VQSSYKSPSLAGGSSVVGVRDAVDAGIIPVGDRHVEESAGDTRSRADGNQIDGQAAHALRQVDVHASILRMYGLTL
jgi:hypothetical protein